MKKIIIFLSALLFVLIIAKINPTITGNYASPITISNPVCQEKYTNVYRCFENRIQRQLVHDNCAKTWVNTVTCRSICVEDIPNSPRCMNTYQEPKFTQDFTAIGKSAYLAIDFSENRVSEAEDKQSDILLKRINEGFALVSGARIKVKAVNKPFDKITYADCAEGLIYSNVALTSGSSVCIPTREGNMAVIGGYWQGSLRKNDILYWKHYILNE